MWNPFRKKEKSSITGLPDKVEKSLAEEYKTFIPSSELRGYFEITRNYQKRVMQVKEELVNAQREIQQLKIINDNVNAEIKQLKQKLYGKEKVNFT